MKLIIRNDVEVRVELTRSVSLGPTTEPESTLRVEFWCDYDAPRPLCWGRLPGSLEAMGFELERDFDGSVEILAPTSFFSAQATVNASKSYPGGLDCLIQSDIAQAISLLDEPSNPFCMDTVFPAKDTRAASSVGQSDSTREFARVI